MGNAERRKRGRAIVDAHLRNVTADEHSSNDRLVDTIVRSPDPGDLPDLLVRTFADHGSDALPEIADMFVKTRDRNPGTASKLFDGLAKGLRKTGQFVKDGRPRGTLEPQPATTGRIEIEDILGGLEDVVKGNPQTLATQPVSAGQEQGELGVTNIKAEAGNTSPPAAPASRLAGQATPSPSAGAPKKGPEAAGSATPGDAFARHVNRVFRGDDDSAKKKAIADITERAKTDPSVLDGLDPLDATLYREAKREIDAGGNPLIALQSAEDLAIRRHNPGASTIDETRKRRAGAKNEDARERKEQDEPNGVVRGSEADLTEPKPPRASQDKTLAPAERERRDGLLARVEELSNSRSLDPRTRLQLKASLQGLKTAKGAARGSISGVAKLLFGTAATEPTSDLKLDKQIAEALEVARTDGAEGVLRRETWRKGRSLLAGRGQSAVTVALTGFVNIAGNLAGRS